MSKYTVVIPHFWPQRKGNLPQIFYALNHSSHPPDEIIVWNNDAPEPILPANVTVIQAPRNIGAKARFLAALCARTEYILFQDNDVMVHADTVSHMLYAAELHVPFADTVIALEGRSLTTGRPYRDSRYINGNAICTAEHIDISLGRLELVRRELVNKAIGQIPFDDTTTMDDIWFSFALAAFGIPRLMIPYQHDAMGFTNLREHGVGAWITNPTHFQERDALCKRLFPIQRG